MKMSVFKNGISPEKFYGKRNAAQDRIEAILKKEKETGVSIKPKLPRRLLGPSTTWKIFKKQQDAMNFCFHRRNGLMCFTFENIDGRRMFLVAHPKEFWSINSDRFFKNCNTYEIIQEFSACKLYLDIEYEYNNNQKCNGSRMLNNLLQIINFNVYEVFKIRVTLDDILDLDSSSDVKFSHHVIYEIKNVAFQHNYAVGAFIKKICTELKSAFESSLTKDKTKLEEVAEKYNLNPDDILELFICDKNGKTKLFLDEGVYTKNRHFRILGSSKQTKNIPLIVSSTNKYTANKTNDPYDCSLFLDSLVTHFSWEVNRILEFECSDKVIRIRNEIPKNSEKEMSGIESTAYKQIDTFINKIISPNGRIRKKVYFSDSSTILYEIQGFRYCSNINREHKSNNIKYIVDLQCLNFYQKCHDPDCQDFRSELKPLPDEIKFLFSDDFIVDSDNCDFLEFSDEIFLQAIEEVDRGNHFEHDISDEDLTKIADCAESMLDINW